MVHRLRSRTASAPALAVSAAPVAAPGVGLFTDVGRRPTGPPGSGAGGGAGGGLLTDVGRRPTGPPPLPKRLTRPRRRLAHAARRANAGSSRTSLSMPLPAHRGSRAQERDTTKNRADRPTALPPPPPPRP